MNAATGSTARCCCPQLRTRRVMAACLLVVSLLNPVAARAQNADLIVGSSTRTTTKRLAIDVDNRWPDNPGYRPLRVTITPTRPPAADRSLMIVVTVISGPGGRGRLTVEQDVTLPAGATVLWRTIPIPDVPLSHSYMINLFEDGEPLKMRAPNGFSAMNLHRRTFDTSRFPRILFVGERMPDVRVLGQYFGAAAYYAVCSASQPGSPQATKPPLPGAFAMASGELPERWIDYTSLDVICLSLDQMARLSKKRPDAARAIVAWAQAGGTLWVYGAGDDWRGLSKLDALLGLSAVDAQQPPPAKDDTSGDVPSGWEKPAKWHFGAPPPWISWHGNQMVEVDQQRYTDKATIREQWGWSRKAPKVPGKPPFLVRRLGFGRVIALASEAPFPGDPWQWGWVFNTMGESSSWQSRYGCSFSGDNPAFWKFLIPGVGLAPATVFRVLISVFVLLIGPVNYLVLRRYKRLHLLVLTIPLGALLVTGVLFGYALICDGLGVKVRGRSLTRIDQRRGQAVCWARLSYYAGLAPRGGLRFSDDVAVLPFPPDEESYSGTHRVTVWDGDQQLARGWLTSRTPIQYFTIRSRASRRGLDIQPARGSGDTLSVKNRLGTSIAMLAIRTHQRKYYWATDLAQGKTGTARPVTEAKAAARLRKVLMDNEPAFPLGMVGQSHVHALGARRRPPYYYHTSVQIPASPEKSLMERGLTALCVAGKIKPGSYVAVVQRQPELELGTPGAEEKGSFHVVLGEW